MTLEAIRISTCHRERDGRGMNVRSFLRAGIALSVFVLSLSPACGGGGNLEEAEASRRRGNYEEAFRILTQYAEKGDMTAQLELGKLYDVRITMHQDVEFGFDLSRLWLERAADQGSAEAQLLLGRSYNHMDAPDRDRDEALRWFLLAGEQGMAEAQAAVAVHYGHREDDWPLAVTWYRRAAEGGSWYAQYELALLYEEGRGVDADSAEAERLLRLAADQGINKAQTALASLLLHGRSQRTEVSAAGEYYETTLAFAAELGYAESQTDLAHYYVREGNLPDAVQLFKLAANQNSVEAEWALCRMYYLGDGVTADFRQAMEWCLRAANQGDPVAQTFVGSLYRFGDHVEEDHAEAARWYLAAAEQGHREAQTRLSDLYEYGLGVSQSDEAAFRWLWLAASWDHGEAQLGLGERYLQGGIVARDFAEALKWSQLAVQSTSPGEFGYRSNLFRIGMMHACGWGTPIDDGAARQWFVRAERGGDDLSMDTEGIIRTLEAIDWPGSQAERRQALCTRLLDEADGSTVEETETTEAEPGANSCTWANDGECDEPNVCSPGTDTNDCRSGGIISSFLKR